MGRSSAHRGVHWGRPSRSWPYDLLSLPDQPLGRVDLQAQTRAICCFRPGAIALLRLSMSQVSGVEQHAWPTPSRLRRAFLQQGCSYADGLPHGALITTLPFYPLSLSSRPLFCVPPQRLAWPIPWSCCRNLCSLPSARPVKPSGQLVRRQEAFASRSSWRMPSRQQGWAGAAGLQLELA